MGDPLKLAIKNGSLYLEGKRLRSVQSYEIRVASTMPKGQAELKLNLMVKFLDNGRNVEASQVQICDGQYDIREKNDIMLLKEK